MEPLFMKPVFQEKIWGGSRLHSVSVLICQMIRSVKTGRSVHILMVSA